MLFSSYKQQVISFMHSSGENTSDGVKVLMFNMVANNIEYVIRNYTNSKGRVSRADYHLSRIQCEILQLSVSN